MRYSFLLALSLIVLSLPFLPSKAASVQDANAHGQASLTYQDEQVAHLLQSMKHTAKEVDKQTNASANATGELLAAFNQQPRLTEAILLNPFKRARANGLKIVDSPDHRLKIFCWGTAPGAAAGTDSVAIFSGKNGPVNCVRLDNDTNYRHVYTEIKPYTTSTNQMVYLVRDNSTGPDGARDLRVRAFVIRGNELAELPFFKVGTNSLQEIESVVTEQSKGIKREIHLHNHDNELIIPVESKSHTSRLVYHFDGNTFTLTRFSH